jgi:hypothetical protein
VPLGLAIKRIALEFVQGSEFRNKIYGIFYKVCKPYTQDHKWGEHHIADDDKIDQLLSSLERVETSNILDAWAGDNTHRLLAKTKILRFIENEQQTDLDLTNLRIGSLPDIFFNSELRTRLTNLYLYGCSLQSIPPEICGLEVCRY